MMLKNCTRVALLAVTCSLVVACNSTPEYTEPDECAPNGEQSCEDSGDDRGYNPCLVNNKLPACKRK